MALGKITSEQSRKQPHKPGSLATDGVLDTSYRICTRSVTELNPWLAIDLGQVVNVCKVKVLNRDTNGKT